MTLRINEIFRTLQGETAKTGFISVFIRLTGCNLDCKYCDTKNAKTEGRVMTIDEIISAVKSYPVFDHVTITGGEPLLQENTPLLIQSLLVEKYSVQVETNGSLPVNKLPADARRIIDVKTPSSGEEKSFLLSNIEHIRKTDEIKFIVSDRRDFDFASEFIKKNLGDEEAVINISPAFGKLSANELANMILSSELNVRLNLQIHKLADIR